jgi:hypothetical protein
MKKIYSVSLIIGGTVIRLHSRRECECLSPFPPGSAQAVFFDSFIYRGGRRPDIDVRIEIQDRLPEKRGGKLLFSSRHYLENSRDWNFYSAGAGFLYESFLSGEKKRMFVNRRFDKVRACLLLNPRRGYVWHWGDIVFNFLQVLLNLYWARRGQAVIIHGCGVRAADDTGIVFAGESGCGKTTMARIWQSHGRAAILNDDRVIVRKTARGFKVFGSPWNGDFDEYAAMDPLPATLKRIFFLRHARLNRARPVSGAEGFNMLYPAIFPVFWDNDLLEKQLQFCVDLSGRVPADCLGFRNNKKVLGFLRARL